MRTLSILIIIAVVIAFTVNGFAQKAVEQKATIENIKAAIKGETTASAKYAAYSKKAKAEGYDRIATLFEAASKAEKIHANNHRAALAQLGETMGTIKPEFEVKTTSENLEDAIKGESYEVAEMYPAFLKKASEENVDIAMISFNYAYKTEQKHKTMYEKALESLKAGNAAELPAKYSVCKTCGNTYDSAPPARCGISMTPRERFIIVG